MRVQTASPIVIGNLKFVLQYRVSPWDRGAVIRVFSVKDRRQALKFDPFINRPHYHLDPDGRNEVRTIRSDDPLAWSLRQISEGLCDLIREAGFEREAVDINQKAVAEAIPALKAQLRTLMRE